jgi:hypothetical protein
MRLPLLILHITGGAVGVLSGYVTIFLRKGSRRHALAGMVFVISMLTMSACGTWLAIMKHEPGNVSGGSLTFYMVLTAWLTARRRERGTSVLDYGALFLVFGIAAALLTFGMEAALSPAGLKDEIPDFIFGGIALLAAIGDIRLLARGGISGTARLSRHLWRMCFGLFVAAASIFLARPHLFPAFMQKTGMLAILSFMPLVLLIFWMIRVRLSKRAVATNPSRWHANPALGRASGD